MVHGRRGKLLVIPKDRRTGEDYVEIVLEGPLWDFYCQMAEERGLAIVMEDGAPTHRSLKAREWRQRNGVEVLPWCTQSPDLNPIKHMWKALKLCINKRPRLPHSEQ